MKTNLKFLLEKRVQNASQVIDRVKEELFGLMKTVLSLQRELIRLVDKIMSSLEIDEELPGLPPKMHEILHLYFALVRFTLQNAIKCRYFVDFNDFDIAYCIHQAELGKQIITY